MKWSIGIYFVIQACWVPNVFAYYHELSRKEIKPGNRGSTRNESYFGYSITYDEHCKNLITGAPRENKIGEVYRCGLDKQECDTKISHPISINSEISNYTQGFWFGASVKSVDRFVVACAPMYPYLWDKFKIPHVITKGTCYFEKNRCNNKMIRMKTVSADTMYYDTFDKSSLDLEKTYSTLGWSIDIDPYDNTIIVGGPAMYTGRAVIYSTLQEPSLLNRTSNKNLLPQYNMGSSVAAGHLLKDGNIYYAVGSTYGQYGEGSVHIFNGYNLDRELPRADKKAVGSAFGAVLCIAKLYDDRSDLLIGAPTYGTPDSYNVGAVYIYIGYDKGSLVYKRTVIGAKDNSYFGSAIVSVGDLDGDDKDEIAIGAPHEDGLGAVYIYSGSDIMSDNDTIVHMQRIQPEGYTSFGMSLAPLKTFNNIGCNELAVGSPYDDAVVVFNCMASIKVELKITFPNLQKRLGKTDFSFEACLHVTFRRDEEDRPIPRNITAEMSTRVEIHHPTARLKEPSPDNALIFPTQLNTSQTEFCEPIGLTLPVNGKYNIKIGYSLTTHLSVDPTKEDFGDGSRVVLSKNSILSLQGSVSAADCNETCTPNLTLTFADNFTSENRAYVIGSQEPLSFTMSVMNTGDVAYDACLLLELPLHMVARHSECANVGRKSSTLDVRHGDMLHCVPRTQLSGDKPWILDKIVLENRFLTSLNHSVSIKASLFDNCIVKKHKDYELIIPMKGDPLGVSVTGETNIGNMVELTKTEVQTDGKKIEHHYTITNNGKTIWAGLNCSINLPASDYVAYILPVTLQYSDTSTKCSSSREDSGTRIICTIPHLDPEGSVRAIIPMQILPMKLDSLKSNENVTITTSITVHLDEETDKPASINTLVRKIDDTVELWVILAATFVGFLLLCLLIFAFYKFGCFRRKNKENLQQLRKSIRRQTIRRSMMPPGGEARLIPVQTPEENEGVDNKSDEQTIVNPSTVK